MKVNKMATSVFRRAVDELWDAHKSQLDHPTLLGYFNTRDIISINADTFNGLAAPVKTGLLAKLAHHIQEPVSAVAHHGNAGTIVIGPKQEIDEFRRLVYFQLGHTNSIHDEHENDPLPVLPPGEIRPHRHAVNTVFTDSMGVNIVTSPTLEAKIDKHHRYVRWIVDKHTAMAAAAAARTKGPVLGPRRPPNAFILYRSDKAPLVKIERPLLSNNEISVLIGEMWRNEEDEMRRCYSYAANFIKTRFLHDNPGYRYQPRRSSEISRRAPRSTRPGIKRRRTRATTEVDEAARVQLREDCEKFILSLFPDDASIRVEMGEFEAKVYRQSAQPGKELVTVIQLEGVENFVQGKHITTGEPIDTIVRSAEYKAMIAPEPPVENPELGGNDPADFQSPLDLEGLQMESEFDLMQYFTQNN